jgi:hypothetical protein
VTDAARALVAPASAGPGVGSAVRLPSAGQAVHWSKRRLALAFAIAGVSDLVSVWTELIVPVQWVVDVGTAGLLFAVLGRQWLLLPGLITEAIPGLALFPMWVLVVGSIAAWGTVRADRP